MDQAGSSAGYQGVIESNNHQDFSCRGVFLERDGVNGKQKRKGF